MLVYWDTDPLIPGLVPDFLDRPGYPSREALIERYERASGIEFVHREFYVVLALYMLAAVCEMFYARYLNGDSEDDLYPQMETRVPRIARRAKELIDGDRTV